MGEGEQGNDVKDRKMGKWGSQVYNIYSLN